MHIQQDTWLHPGISTKSYFKSRLHNSWPKVAKSGLPSQSTLKADAFAINNCQPSFAYILITFTFTNGVGIILGWLTSNFLYSGLTSRFCVESRCISSCISTGRRLVGRPSPLLYFLSVACRPLGGGPRGPKYFQGELVLPV